MKSPKRTLPRGTGYERRAIALATRLGIDVPPQPLTDAQWTTLWAAIGKILLRIEPPEPLTLKTLWADVGNVPCRAERTGISVGAWPAAGKKKQTVVTETDAGSATQEAATPETWAGQILRRNICPLLKDYDRVKAGVV